MPTSGRKQVLKSIFVVVVGRLKDELKVKLKVQGQTVGQYLPTCVIAVTVVTKHLINGHRD